MHKIEGCLINTGRRIYIEESLYCSLIEVPGNVYKYTKHSISLEVDYPTIKV